MPWINDRIIGQGQEFRADAPDQEFAVAARKIKTADAALEEHVAAENACLVARTNENDVARRVAGDFKHFQVNAGRIHAFSFREGPIGSRAGDGRAEQAAQVGHRVSQKVRFVYPNQKGRVGIGFF